MKYIIFNGLCMSALLFACQSKTPTSTQSNIPTDTTYLPAIRQEHTSTEVIEIDYETKAWSRVWSDKNAWEAAQNAMKSQIYFQSDVFSIEGGQFDIIDAEDSFAKINTDQKDPEMGYAIDAQALTPFADKQVYLKMTKQGMDTTLWVTIVEPSGAKKTNAFMPYRPVEDLLVGEYRMTNNKNTNAENISFSKGGKMHWKKYTHHLMAEAPDGTNIVIFYTKKTNDECLNIHNAALFVLKYEVQNLNLYEYNNFEPEDCLDNFEYDEGYPKYVGTLKNPTQKYTLSRI